MSIDTLRRRLRDALPRSLGMCLTLRANPILGFLFAIFRRKFYLEGMVFEVPLRGQPLTSLATYWFNDYELPERRFCHQYIRPSDSVCELGGCLGVVSMVINRRLSNPERHLVIEANPLLIPLLNQNRETNGGSFIVLNRAVGDGLPLELDVSSGLLTSHRNSSPGQNVKIVDGCALDGLFAEYGPFDVIVMDVEGAEQQVLLGKSHAWKNVRVIIIEWHPSIIGDGILRDAREALADAGFECSASQSGALHVVEVWERRAK